MPPSSILCRAQEAHHRALARAAILDNVRNIANAAAMAWAKEAAIAEHREARKLRPREVAAGPVPHAPGIDERAMSENPDRGFAAARNAIVAFT